jgi:hypothetical protein
MKEELLLISDTFTAQTAQNCGIMRCSGAMLGRRMNSQVDESI